jgi:hypothetical protein
MKKNIDKKNYLKVNEFYDINKFPAKKGILVFGISMPFIDKKQSPKNLFNTASPLTYKIRMSGVGDIMVYSDGLYMHSDEKSAILKKKFQKQMEEHKEAYLKIIKKDIFLIPSAFTFTTWSQLILNCPKFQCQFDKIKKIYKEDDQFQKLVMLDISSAEKKVGQNTINYILEEILLDYLVAKGRVRLQNDYVQDKEEWILNCYNGKPHRSHVYIHQKNLLKIESDNIYQNSWYDLDNKKLYEFDRLDLGSFDFR